MGHEVYELWRTIGNRGLSADGGWIHYVLELENDDGELVLAATDGSREHRFPRGAQPTFNATGTHALFTIRPSREALREARNNRAGGQPRDTLAMVALASGEVTKVPEVQSWRLASDPAPEPDPASGAARWVAYHLTPQASVAEGEDAPRSGTLVLRDLTSGEERRIPHAASYTWASRGGHLLVTEVTPAQEGEGGTTTRLLGIQPGTDGVTTVMAAPGDFRGVTIRPEGNQVAFLHAAPAATPAEGDTDTANAGENGNDRSWSLFHWREGDAQARVVAAAGSAGLTEGWSLSENASPSFSEDGRRIFFGTVPPAPAPAELSELESQVDVEIWHWLDAELMTVQNVRAGAERRRSFQAVLHLGQGSRGAAAQNRIVQLADPALPQVNVPQGGTASFALARDTERYGIESSWESPNFADVWTVDVATGERTLLMERTQGNPSLSPEGRFLTWWQPGDSTWYAREVATGETRNLSAMIPHPLWNERNDSPSPPGSYGTAGWIEGDRGLLLYDSHDLWVVDPSGRTEARSVTGGEGRAANLRYRVVRLDGSGGDAWAPDAELFLSVFNPGTKEAGFARTRLNASGQPELLLLEDRNFSNPVKAADADLLLFTQETFQEFPDLWVSGMDLADRRRLSEANPQQADYRWGTAELVEWLSADGIPLQGVLMKPEDFDPNRQYPMVVYFYERWSDGLHDHYALVPHRSRIAFPMYTSNDYIVFIPDIVYRNGYPGEGGLNAVNPGIFKLIEQGFVDRERIALQGHSWGGYQIAFMVTRSQNLYRAAAAGAPVANMTSAYGGIRRQTGLVRQFQYERTQSRLGGSLWEMPLRYLENSPLFWLDKVETPLLIMHNDADGHVPWEQGIELFVGLRRLGKPAWMVNYRGEPHWPTTFANRVDWNVRMKQFFDHFLKDAPPPAWMVEGIPAIRRGETLGYEPVPGASAVEDRYDGRR
jgi:dipeptidyl aminopeptidase/acylaminoacyl peptidase